MQVTIEHRQKDALLPRKKLHYVDCTILFSEEEKAIIHERGLRRHFITTDSGIPPASPILSTAGSLLKVISLVLFLGGCVAGLALTFAGKDYSAGLINGICWLVALATFFVGIALRRYARVAEDRQQKVTLGRLLTNPSFSAYAFDNARAKRLDEEIRFALTSMKDGLLANRDIRQRETFKL